MLHAIGQTGYELIEALGGKDGVRLAQSERPDLILMDIQLPEMDGYAKSGFPDDGFHDGFLYEKFTGHKTVGRCSLSQYIELALETQVDAVRGKKPRTRS